MPKPTRRRGVPGGRACLLYSQDGGPVEWPLKGLPGGEPLAVRGACRVNTA